MIINNILKICTFKIGYMQFTWKLSEVEVYCKHKVASMLHDVASTENTCIQDRFTLKNTCIEYDLKPQQFCIIYKLPYNYTAGQHLPRHTLSAVFKQHDLPQTIKVIHILKAVVFSST